MWTPSFLNSKSHYVESQEKAYKNTFPVMFFHYQGGLQKHQASLQIHCKRAVCPKTMWETRTITRMLVNCDQSTTKMLNQPAWKASNWTKNNNKEQLYENICCARTNLPGHIKARSMKSTRLAVSNLQRMTFFGSLLDQTRHPSSMMNNPGWTEAWIRRSHRFVRWLHTWRF